MRLFALFPDAVAEGEPNAIVAVRVGESVEVHVVFSRDHVEGLITRHVGDPEEVRTLRRYMEESTLPPQDPRSPVVIRGYSMARIFHAQAMALEMGDFPALLCTFPAIYQFEVILPKQQQKFGRLGFEPDFLGAAMDHGGRPEIVIGWSKAHARQYLDVRRSWYLAEEQAGKWRDHVEASVLPEDHERDPVCISGQAAAALLELFVYTGLYRLSLN